MWHNSWRAFFWELIKTTDKCIKHSEEKKGGSTRGNSTFKTTGFFFLYNANMSWEFPLTSLPLSPLADQGQSVLSHIFVLRLIWHMIPSCNLHPVRNLERSSPPDSEVIIPCHVTLTGLANSVKQNSWSSLCTLSLINKAFLVERAGGQVGRERRQ